MLFFYLWKLRKTLNRDPLLFNSFGFFSANTLLANYLLFNRLMDFWYPNSLILLWRLFSFAWIDRIDWPMQFILINWNRDWLFIQLTVDFLEPPGPINEWETNSISFIGDVSDCFSTAYPNPYHFPIDTNPGAYIKQNETNKEKPSEN